MSQWSQVIQLGLIGEVRLFYKRADFPINIRMLNMPNFNPTVLESSIKELNAVNPDNPLDIVFFANFKQIFFSSLSSALNQAMTENSNQSLQILGFEHELKEEGQELAIRFEKKPVEFFRSIKSCFDYENSLIVQKLQNNMNSPPTLVGSPFEGKRMEQNSEYIRLNNLLSLFLSTEGTETGLSQINSLHLQIQQSIGLVHYWLQNPKHAYPNASAGELDKIAAYLTAFTNKATELFNSLVNISEEYVIKFLREWMIEMRRAEYGLGFVHSLEDIAILANKIASGLIWLYNQMRFEDDVRILANQRLKQPVSALNLLLENIKKEIVKLLEKTFIVEQQPPRILYVKEGKTAIKPTVVVRQLVNINCINPKVEAVLTDGHEKIKISNNEENFVYDAETKKFQASFANIKMPAKRKGDDETQTVEEESSKKGRVTQRKYFFHFTCVFHLVEFDIAPFPIRSNSLPVIILSNPHQNSRAWATILWDNAFALEGRNDFKVAEEVTCEEMMDVLSLLFQKYTGRGLSKVNREFLSIKLMGNFERSVTWEMFADPRPEGPGSDKLVKFLKASPNGRFKEMPATFSSWIFSIIEMFEPSSRDSNIAQYWKEGRITGFITKEQVTKSLMNSRDGTFSLYFSETLLSGLTIVRYDHEKQCLQKLEPFLIDGPVPLEKHIAKIEYLQYLLEIEDGQTCFRSLPKSKAFSNITDDNKENLSKLQTELWSKGYSVLYQNQQLCNLLSPPFCRSKSSKTPSFSNIGPIEGSSRMFNK